MNHFNWDLMFVTPGIVVRSLLSNGVIFDHESFGNESSVSIAHKVCDRANYMVESLVKERI